MTAIWLAAALLPLAALAFRRGWLLALPLVITVTLGSLPQPAMASAWDDLLQRHDQQAAQDALVREINTLNAAEQKLITQQGAVVAMDPRNGEILALVSWPALGSGPFVE